nr:MAG TPA: hypothetical protein [Caudoviricetes sp.]
MRKRSWGLKTNIADAAVKDIKNERKENHKDGDGDCNGEDRPRALQVGDLRLQKRDAGGRITRGGDERAGCAGADVAQAAAHGGNDAGNGFEPGVRRISAENALDGLCGDTAAQLDLRPGHAGFRL